MKKAIFFLALVFIYNSAAAQNWDLRVYDNLYAHRSESLDETMNIFSGSVYPVAIAVPLIQVVYGLAKKDYKHAEYGLQTTTGLILNTALTYGLKYTIKRKRPYDEHPQYTPDEHDSSPSFPSGHASYAFATATSLSLQYKKWYVVAPAYLWSAGVAYSRIHKGAHYPSDVIVGAIVGAGSAYLSYKGNQWIKHWWKKKTQQTFVD